MNLEIWFWIAHVVALAGWLPMMAWPSRSLMPVKIARWAAAALAVGYAVIFFAHAPQGSELATSYSLAGVGAFFATPPMMLLGWVHYLAFDLFVGAWETEEAHRLEMPRGLLFMCLLLTFLLGPLGLLAFLAARSTRNSIAS